MRAESFPALIPISSLQNRPMVSTSLKDISGTKEYLINMQHYEENHVTSISLDTCKSERPWEMECFPPCQETRTSQSSVTALQASRVSPQGTQEGGECMGPGSHQAAAAPYGEPQGSAQDVRKRPDTGPGELRCIWKEQFQWVQTHTFPNLERC